MLRLGYFVLLTWLPTYFSMQLGFDLASSSFVSVLPWIAMFFSANLGGYIADNLLAKGASMTFVRKLMQTIGFLGPATFLSLVAMTNAPEMAVAYMTAALALGSFSQSGVYSNHQDIGPTYSGILLGMRCVSVSLLSATLERVRMDQPFRPLSLTLCTAYRFGSLLPV